jgi:hypothetical protein
MRHWRKEVIIKFRKCKSNVSKVDPKHHTERQKRISVFDIVLSIVTLLIIITREVWDFATKFH